MDFGVVTTLLQQSAEIIVNLKNNVTNYTATRSLADVTKLTRVEPLTIVSRDLANVEYVPDVMQTMLSMFSGYYLQAVNMLTKVHNVEVLRILDRLNPDRDESAFLLSAESADPRMTTFVLENYKHKLPMGAHTLSKEDKAMSDDIRTLAESANLAIGKILSVEITAGNADDKDAKRVKVSVAVRLATSLVASSTMLHLLALKKEDTSLVERYHAWSAGRISLVNDLIFCQDLIDEYKRAMIGDSSGTIQEIIRRVNNSKKYGLLTKNPSLVSASNIFIISEENARELEQMLGGKMTNFRTREKAFENTYAMIIAVVDREYDRITFYTRGINAGTDVSVTEMKAANKSKGGIDIADVMKSMSMGANASF